LGFDCRLPLRKFDYSRGPQSTSLRHASGPSENFARSVSQDHERCRGVGRSEKRSVDVDTTTEEGHAALVKKIVDSRLKVIERAKKLLTQ